MYSSYLKSLNCLHGYNVIQQKTTKISRILSFYGNFIEFFFSFWVVTVIAFSLNIWQMSSNSRLLLSNQKNVFYSFTSYNSTSRPCYFCLRNESFAMESIHMIWNDVGWDCIKRTLKYTREILNFISF